jgi:hypothetical protein
LSNKIRIMTAMADAKSITLYLENGKTHILAVDDAFTSQIMEKITIGLARREIMEIDLDDYSIEKLIEKKTNGVIRFFKKLIGSPTTIDREIIFAGKLKSDDGHTYIDETSITGTQPSVVVLDEVSESSTGVEPENEEDGDIPDTGETVIEKEEAPTQTVAVVRGVEIPNTVENMKPYIDHAIKTDNFMGLQAFMERLAAVAKYRQHTAQELLNFMKRGDLPIADNGHIIAYKVLRVDDRQKGIFVDPRTRLVKQRVGSLVYMDHKLVNPSRRTECSSGLHIARRGYLGSFTGDTIVLCKIAPEDVVAVPMNEPDKMRVAGYHILFELPSEAQDLLRRGQPMTSNKVAAQMLADAIAGNHTKIISTTKIGGEYGTNLEIKDVVEGTVVPEPKSLGKEAKALDDGPKGSDVGRTNIKELRKTVEKTIAEKKAEDAKKPVDKAKSETGSVQSTTSTETAAERAARRKREKRAAEKQAKEKAEALAKAKPEDAARHKFGNNEAAADILEKKSSKTPSNQKKETSKDVPVAPKSKSKKPKDLMAKTNPVINIYKDIPDTYRKAVEKVHKGELSQRAAATAFGVSDKKIREYLKTLPPKA